MRTFIIDSQNLSMFQECGEKYRLTFKENLKPTFAAPPLTKGGVLHTGLESYYKYLMAHPGEDRLLIHNQAVELAKSDAEAKAALIDINLDDANEVIYQIGEYLEYYKDDDIQPIAVEEPFLKVLYESVDDDFRLIYAGKVDLVATAARYQWKPVPFDNKSSARNQTPSGRSNQFFGYCWALDSNILVVNKVGFQKTLSPAERFKRYPLSYPQEYREQWVRNTIKWGYKLAWAIENDEWEENLTSCDKYSGCIFLPICESITPEAKEWKIRTEFITGEPWDVTKVLGLQNDPNEKVFTATTELAESSGPNSPSSNDRN